MMRTRYLLPLAMLCGTCQSPGRTGSSLQHAPREWRSKSPTAAAIKPAQGTPAEYRVAGHRIELIEEKGHCWLVHREGDEAPERLNLNLIAPCHVLTWRHAVGNTVDPGGASSGVPLGEEGEPVAWRYRTAEDAIVIAIIGDPVGSDQANDKRYQKMVQLGYRCGSTTRGVLFAASGVRLSREHFDGSTRCVEVGMDELQYNILAHDSNAASQ